MSTAPILAQSQGPQLSPDIRPPADQSSAWDALQLRIARRADELARDASPFLQRGSGRLLWAKAECEILGPTSHVSLADLFGLCARLGGRSPEAAAPRPDVPGSSDVARASGPEPAIADDY